MAQEIHARTKCYIFAFECKDKAERAISFLVGNENLKLLQMDCHNIALLSVLYKCTVELQWLEH